MRYGGGRQEGFAALQGSLSYIKIPISSSIPAKTGFKKGIRLRFLSKKFITGRIVIGHSCFCEDEKTEERVGKSSSEEQIGLEELSNKWTQV